MPELSASLRVPNYSAAPTTPTPAAGHLYYDTVANKLYVYTGSAWQAVASGAGTGDVTGPSSSVDSEIALFSSTTGKIIKRATGSGIATVASGVLGTTPDNHANWDTAFTNTLRWDGGSTSLVAATGRTSLGGTTVGQSFFTLANPGAITFPKISALNAVTAESAATHMTSLGGTTVGQAFFTLTNPGAITFPKMTAANAVVAESAATHITSLGLAASATTDTTNASNISSGTLATARGALPTGGVAGDTLIKQSGTNFDTAWKTTPYCAYNPVTNPTGTNSTSGVMMGLGGTSKGVITPAMSGNVVIIISGYAQDNTANNGALITLKTGTGTAPANAAAATGTTRGNSVPVCGYGGVACPVNLVCPWAINALVTGLAIGTAVWIDVAVIANPAGTITLSGNNITAFELP